MEPQRYPELRAGISGPTKKPYDVAGWTLPMLMGVGYDRVDKPFTGNLEPAEPPSLSQPTAVAGRKWSRIALYEPWQPNSDTGWTQWVLDRLQIPHTLLHNADIRKGDLGSRFDTIVFASQETASPFCTDIESGENASSKTISAIGENFRRRKGPSSPAASVSLRAAAALDEFIRERRAAGCDGRSRPTCR